MDRIISSLLTCIALALTTCSVSCVTLRADFSVSGVKAVMELSQAGSGSSTTFTLQPSSKGIPSSAVTVEIRSNWINYETVDPCSDSNLGTNVETKSWDVSAGNSFTLSRKLDTLEGKSILIRTNSMRACASIWNPDAPYRTAMATFGGDMVGAIYFRRPDGESKTTVVLSDFGWNGTPGTLSWRITDEIDECNFSDELFESDMFEHGGNLNSELGDPSVGNSKSNLVKKSYRSQNLALDSTPKSIVGKFIIVYSVTNTAKAGCGRIRSVLPRKATAQFSHQGIRGDISFSQTSPFDSTETKVNLKGLNSGANKYRVHLYPVPVQTEKDQDVCGADAVDGHFNPYSITNFPGPAVGTEDQYAIGDLSSKYGTLDGLKHLTTSYKDLNLPLFGKNSIVGRSLVINRDDTAGSRWVCSNILLDGAVVSAVATFNMPLYGHIYFTQAENSPDSDTWIFVQYSSLQDASDTTTTGHKWTIHEEEMQLKDPSGSTTMCTSPISALMDPYNGEVCTPANARTRTCQLGDMSAKHGTLSITTTTVKVRAFFTDSQINIQKDNEEAILGKSIVITGTNSKPLACTNIRPLHKPMLKAEISLGTISFMQQPGFGQRPTTVTTSISQFEKVKIYSLPPGTDSKCSELGQVYNPLDVTGNPAGDSTHDLFKIGDLSRGQSGWQDLNLPLTGLTSIRHRSLVVVDGDSVSSCGVIQDPFSKTFGGYQVHARVTFGAPLVGNIHLFQTLFEDDTTTETSIVVDLSNADGTKTLDHNWHVHEATVSGDSLAETKRCASTGPHFDPYLAKTLALAGTKYGKRCSKTNPFRCEVGDQAKKVGTYSLGSGRAVFTDVDLPLDGLFKVQGRSIVVHVQNKGAARYACANIYPVSDTYLVFEFKTPQTLDLNLAATRYASVTHGDAWNVVPEVVSTDEENTKIHLHFLGSSRDYHLSKFERHFKSEADREKFGDYAPLEAPVTKGKGIPDSAGTLAFSMVLMLGTLVINAVVFHY